MTHRLLAALALSVLPLRARAQSAAPAGWAPDASGLTLPAPAAAAATAKPSADPAKILSILRRVRDGGVYDPGDASTPPSFMLGEVSGSTSAAHDEDYVSAMGFVSKKDGLFYPALLNFISERWTIGPKGNWTIKQWLFAAGIDGRVRFEMHNVLHETPDHHVLGEKEQDPASGSDAEFAALVSRWAAYTPQGGKP